MQKALKYLIVLIFLALPGFSEEDLQKSTICLNMIVKNEKDVICRCLASVLPLIDTWVIVDTGSTDGTQEIIKTFLKDVPGELHERPWVNFGHNRNEALSLAKNKADYILFMDADDILSYAKDFKMPQLTKDFYQFPAETNHHQFRVMNLIKSDVNWKWYGAIHEYLQAGKDTVGEIFDQIRYVYINDGMRSKDPSTYQKDLALLQEAIKTDPLHKSRHYFYLAKTYLLCKDYEKSLETFEKRSRMEEGWDEEIFASKLSIGQIQNLLKKDATTVKNSFIDAYLYKPLRSEPIYYLLEKILEEQNYEKGFEIAKVALDLPKRSNAALFEELWVCDYGIPYQYAFCAAKTGRYKEGLEMCEKLLKREDLTPQARERIQECEAYIQQQITLEIREKLQKIIAS